MTEATETAPAPAFAAPAPAANAPAPSDDINPLQSFYDEFDAADAPKLPKPAFGKEKPAPKAKTDPEAEEETAPEKETAPKAEAKAPEKPSKPDDAEPTKIPELRKAYQTQKAALKERESEISRLKGELEKVGKNDFQGEKQSLLERLTATEKHNAELAGRLKLLDYQQTDDFKKQYWAPYQKAMQTAISDLEEVEYDDAQGNKQKVDHGVITWLASQKPAAAAKLMQQMFGDLSGFVQRRIDNIREAANSMNEAVEEHRKSAGELSEKQKVEALKFQDETKKLWESENQSWPTKFPAWFKPREGDDERNTLLNSGYDMADKLFSANGVSPQEKLKLAARARHYIAGFSPMALDLKRARSKIKELETSLAEYEKSEPPSTASTGGRGKSQDKEFDPLGDVNAEFDALERKSR